jgi:hypothetical protein
VTSGKDRLLRQAPSIRRARGQAVKHAGGSRRPSQWGARSSSIGPGDPCRPFCWGPHRTSHQGAAWECLHHHLQGQRGPCEGEERRHDPGNFSFSLILSICTHPLPRERNIQTQTHTRTLHQRLGSLIPLSPICNPYCKPSARAQAPQTGRRDILPEPV